MAIDSVKNLFAIAELRKRVLFTLGLLIVYRIGESHHDSRREYRGARSSSPSRRAARCSASTTCSPGNNLSQMTIFALGIMPYISASIILQLLTVVWPFLERISKEGELGRRKITQYTRYGTILLSVVQSLGIAHLARALDADRRRAAARLQPGLGLPPDDGADAHDRHDAHHVARRADYRARHRQRHVADHLRRHRRRACRPRSSPRSISCAPGRWG